MSPLQTYQFNSPPAVVVGTCGHGLATIRALRAGGVDVLAIEATASLPGAHTRLAPVVLVRAINGGELIDVLLEVRTRIDCPGKPVLFLTNDNMVRTLAQHWPKLETHFLLSWAHWHHYIAQLIEKTNLEAHSKKQGCNYPASYLLRSNDDVDAAVAVTGEACIIKPAKPLSGFKTALPGDRKDIKELVSKFAADLPFVAQQFIPGDDDCIYFCALYLDKGKEIARFDGRKLRSWPMGHTTVAESAVRQDVYEETLKFFQGLELSGPVSLELKRDSAGKLWVIEPTVGRTDFWLGLCTANGVNIPLTEYCSVLNLSLPENKQCDRTVWFNEERDPYGRLWLARHPTHSIGARDATYLFLHLDDIYPTLLFLKNKIPYIFLAVINRLSKLLLNGFRTSQK